jgi:hypothetical protein
MLVEHYVQDMTAVYDYLTPDNNFAFVEMPMSEDLKDALHSATIIKTDVKVSFLGSVNGEQNLKIFQKEVLSALKDLIFSQDESLYNITSDMIAGVANSFKKDFCSNYKNKDVALTLISTKISEQPESVNRFHLDTSSPDYFFIGVLKGQTTLFYDGKTNDLLDQYPLIKLSKVYDETTNKQIILNDLIDECPAAIVYPKYGFASIHSTSETLHSAPSLEKDRLNMNLRCI